MGFHKIAIWGQYKSGTTALFHKIKPALSPPLRTLFEPSRFVPEPNDEAQNLLAKIILGDERVDYPSLSCFDSNVYITRDSRDWLVSGTLFIVQQEPAIYRSSRRMAVLLDLLKLKEKAPQTVALHHILDRIAAYIPGSTLAKTLDWLKNHQAWLWAFENDHPHFFRFKYENLVDRKFAGLSHYLKLPLVHRIQLPDQHRHVIRTKGYGNWRHWFTPEDVAIFKPIFSAYLKRHGYTLDWTLADDAQIDPSFCSNYVMATVERRLQQLL